MRSATPRELSTSCRNEWEGPTAPAVTIAGARAGAGRAATGGAAATGFAAPRGAKGNCGTGSKAGGGTTQRVAKLSLGAAVTALVSRRASTPGLVNATRSAAPPASTTRDRVCPPASLATWNWTWVLAGLTDPVTGVLQS